MKEVFQVVKQDKIFNFLIEIINFFRNFKRKHFFILNFHFNYYYGK